MTAYNVVRLHVKPGAAAQEGHHHYLAGLKTAVD